jgi:hypothetical protein
MKHKMAMSGKELFSMQGSRGVDAAGKDERKHELQIYLCFFFE